MQQSHPPVGHGASSRAPAGRGLLNWYEAAPRYARILAALALGILTGYGLRQGAEAGWVSPAWPEWLRAVYSLILKLLGALATPLIFVAVLHALVRAQVSG